MSDLAAGLGLAFVIEGLLWALFPGFGMLLLAVAASAPENTLRFAGLVAAGAGAGLVWLVRG